MPDLIQLCIICRGKGEVCAKCWLDKTSCKCEVIEMHSTTGVATNRKVYRRALQRVSTFDPVVCPSCGGSGQETGN